MLSTLSARLQHHLSPRALLAVGKARHRRGRAGARADRPDSSWTLAVPGFILLGTGVGLAFPTLMGLAIGVVLPGRTGVAAGMANTFFPLGTGAGVAAFVRCPPRRSALLAAPEPAATP